MNEQSLKLTKSVVITSINYAVVVRNAAEGLAVLSKLQRDIYTFKQEVFVVPSESAAALCRTRHMYMCTAQDVEPMALPVRGRLNFRRDAAAQPSASVPQALNPSVAITPVINNALVTPTPAPLLQGLWLVSAANGYAVASSNQSLFGMIDDDNLQYIHAVYSGADFNYAAFLARQDYVSRFFRRYGAQFVPTIPFLAKPDTYFIDDWYHQREIDREDDDAWTDLQNHGVI